MIHKFIQQVRLRLNAGVALNSLFVSLLAISILTIMIGAVYLLQGYAVSDWVFYGASSLLFISWIVLWILRRASTHQAAVYSDNHFKLKDSIISSLEFETKEEHKYTKIQFTQTEKKLKGLSAKDVPISFSKKLMAASLVCGVAAVSLSFIPTSAAVLQKQDAEKQMTERTEEIKKELEEVVEKMIDDMSNEEKALLNPDEIRKWIKELKPTGKEREAMLNIARAKQQIQKKIASLENRKNEALLKAAGLKLQESSKSKSQKAGDAMSQKDFDKVKKALEDFKLKKNKDEEDENKLKDLLDKLKNAENLTEQEKEKLREQLKKKLDDLRDLAKRMGEAAGEGAGDMGNGEFADGEGFDLNNLPQGLELDQLMRLLDKHGMDMQDFMDGQQLDGEPMDEDELKELMEMMEQMDDQLEMMQGEMDEMEARKKLREKLESLRMGLGKGLGYAQGKSSRLRLNMPGGKKPGVGTDNSRRKERDQDIDNKNLSRIKGQQGNGPVQKKTEAADSGTGTSHKTGSAKERDYQRQMSSYLNRDDIPEDMKQAMQQYYKDIHELGDAGEEESK